MLRIKTITTAADPVRVPVSIRGEEIILWIRPWSGEIADEIRRKFVRGFEWVQNAVTGKREKQEIIDDDGYFSAMLDHILAGFDGIGDESGAAWPKTLEYKKRVIAIAVEKGAVPLWERILDEARSLAFVQAQDDADAEKN